MLNYLRLIYEYKYLEQHFINFKTLHLCKFLTDRVTYFLSPCDGGGGNTNTLGCGFIGSSFLFAKAG